MRLPSALLYESARRRRLTVGRTCHAGPLPSSGRRSIWDTGGAGPALNVVHCPVSAWPGTLVETAFISLVSLSGENSPIPAFLLSPQDPLALGSCGGPIQGVVCWLTSSYLYMVKRIFPRRDFRGARFWIRPRPLRGPIPPAGVLPLCSAEGEGVRAPPHTQCPTSSAQAPYRSPWCIAPRRRSIRCPSSPSEACFTGAPIGRGLFAIHALQSGAHSSKECGSVPRTRCRRRTPGFQPGARCNSRATRRGKLRSAPPDGVRYPPLRCPSSPSEAGFTGSPAYSFGLPSSGSALPSDVTLRLLATPGFTPSRTGLRPAPRCSARPRSAPSGLLPTAPRFAGPR